MVLFIFCFEPEIPYLDKFGQIKIVYFSWNLASRLTLFRSRPEISLGLKLKVVYWRWNLVYSLIWICWIRGCCSLFCFGLEIPYLGKFGLKNKIVCISWNLIPSLIRICWTRGCCSLFLFWTRDTLFGQIWSKNQNCLFLC